MPDFANRQKAPLVQQGPLPVYFVTGLVAIDAQSEFVTLTFCTDQCWGGAAVAEREISVRLVVPRSAFATMRAHVAEKIDQRPRLGH